MVRSTKLLSAVALAAFLLATHLPLDLTVRSAEAQRRPAPACGLRAFPFVAGTEMVYEARPIPGQPEPRQPPAKPIRPDKITIKVLSVTTIRGVSTIQLEESTGYITRNTTLVCSSDKIDVPLESFFFAGEPGGSLDVEVDNLQRKGNSYLFRYGQVLIPEWTEDLTATFRRIPVPESQVKLTGGSLDLQRHMLIGRPEPITTDLGPLKASPVQIELLGTVSLDIQPEPFKWPVPANTVSKLWFADNLGVVQVFNPNNHLYMLTAINQFTPGPAPALPAGTTPATPARPAPTTPARPAPARPAPAPGTSRPKANKPRPTPANPTPAEPKQPPTTLEPEQPTSLQPEE